MSMTPEGRVKHAVKKVLQLQGIYFFMPVQNGMGKVGIPDFICCVPQLGGRFLAIETKAPGKRDNTTPNQKRELAAIESANGLAIVVDDADQFEAFLARLLVEV